MPIDPNLVRAVFDESFECFLAREVDVLVRGVNERNNCGRLAIYMQGIANEHGLDSYYADVEYNRNDIRVKTILDDAYRVITINCDLILHSRGKIVIEDNLIAVEIKKSERPPGEKQENRDRLRALTKDSDDGIWSPNNVTLPKHVCGYVLGVYIEVNRTKRICLVEYYSSGVQTERAKRQF